MQIMTQVGRPSGNPWDVDPLAPEDIPRMKIAGNNRFSSLFHLQMNFLSLNISNR